MASFDVHEQNADGRPGKLLDTIDRVPEIHKSGTFIEFDGELQRVFTGIRNFIIVTQERWARVSAASWRRL
ncbi:hypothetical protein [Pseudomonas gorinensis]